MSILTEFVHSLMALIHQHGYLGIFAVIGLEYACFPIPSEVVLPFVGLSVTQTHFSFLAAFLVSILAGLAGSSFCYLIGSYGEDHLTNWLTAHSKQAEKAAAAFNKWFNRYGHWAVLFARIVPLTRTYISIFAGASHMSFGIFLLYSSTGIAFWNLILMSLGFYIGDNLLLVGAILKNYSHIILLLLGLFCVVFLLKKMLIKEKSNF